MRLLIIVIMLASCTKQVEKATETTVQTFPDFIKVISDNCQKEYWEGVPNTWWYRGIDSILYDGKKIDFTAKNEVMGLKHTTNTGLGTNPQIHQMDGSKKYSRNIELGSDVAWCDYYVETPSSITLEVYKKGNRLFYMIKVPILISNHKSNPPTNWVVEKPSKIAIFIK